MIIKEERKTSGFLPILKGIGVLIIGLMVFDHVSESNIVKQSIDGLLTVVDSTRSVRIASSSIGDDLSNEELAWHAAHSYGWDCEEVVLRGRMKMGTHFSITCSNGTVLRVYPRHGMSPRITNRSGGNL